eukprot:Plantae.Rhodophyta-Hildenbrandia_rubra.ctg4130.p2 GENE.Plantae.Rhodophyta-Hildenbrandia_rubra.ctg4130~~Plantae.Rhodophyta-Hildenbrandia_rubra.ctg4130.p2  ORF type:complete len:446 (-),score=83.45 Plantae.Rhodophyta-Hildenbrandia_rubra.ctg4130:698-2035(-)
MTSNLSRVGLTLATFAGITSINKLYALSPPKKSSAAFTTEDGEPLALAQIQVICRHGARSPLTKLGLGAGGEYRIEWDVCGAEDMKKVIDIEGEIYGGGVMGQNKILESGREDEGHCRKGQLSVVGARQMSRLGEMLREKYVEEYGFLDDVLDLDNVQVRSTYMERAVNSALALMSGVWPRNKRNGVEKIPVFIPENHEEILFPNSKACARLKHLFSTARKEIESDPDYVEVERRINTVGPEAIGFRGGDSWHHSPLMLRDFFAALEAHDKEAPVVVTEEFRSLVDKLTTRYVRERLYRKEKDEYDPEVLRLASGPLLQEVLRHLEENRKHKLLLFSGHDATLIPLLAILDHSKLEEWPPFASSIIFEVYEQANGSGESYIRVLYNGEALTMKNCPKGGAPCKLSIFRKNVVHYLSLNRSDECQMQATEHSSESSESKGSDAVVV